MRHMFWEATNSVWPEPKVCREYVGSCDEQQHPQQRMVKGRNLVFSMVSIHHSPASLSKDKCKQKNSVLARNTALDKPPIFPVSPSNQMASP